MYLRVLILLGFACCGDVHAEANLSRSDSLAVDAAEDGRLAMDLGGDLWVVPAGGGDARHVRLPLNSVRGPRWAPDGQRLVFSARQDSRHGIWIYDLEKDRIERLGKAGSFDLYPDWHPDGERILLSADSGVDGFDLWEVDVPTGLRWRLSDRPGDESEGAWSANGRDLVYVHHVNDTWSLILRRHAQVEEVLLSSKTRISAPSWRPDGSLIAYFSDDGSARTLQILILSEPRLVRPYANQEAFSASPVSWLDRQTMIYSANGQIRKKDFDAWRSRSIRFRASVSSRPKPIVRRDRPVLEWPAVPQGDLVIRAARLFDGLQTDYLHDRDILIRGGRIAEISKQQERPGTIVIDLGDLAILPGLVDADARLPGRLAPSHGPDMLATGVTSIVATHPDVERLNRLWAGKEVPGPRFLDRDVWRSGASPRPDLDAGAAVLTSQSTGIATGESLATQIRGMQVAGLTPLQILRGMGVNAAGAILADPYVGRVAPGAAADLVFVDGDPLADINDLLNVVAVLRNGRFYSVSGLFDRAKSAASVE